MNAVFWVMVPSILVGCATATPARVNSHGADEVVIGGNLTVLQALEVHLPRLERASVGKVVFEDCLGGQLGGVDAVSEVIRRRGLHAEARGTVASGCALAFLAADSRSLDRDVHAGTKLILHGAYTVGEDGSRELSKSQIGELSDYIHARTQGKISKAIASYVASVPDHRDGLTVYANPIEFEGVRANVIFCDRTRPLKSKPCTVLTGADAFSLGLETHE